MKLSRITRCLGSFLAKCCSSLKHYLLDEKALDGKIKANYEVANSLSRYCACIPACVQAWPDLLPDTILVLRVLLQKAVGHARDRLKSFDDSWQRIYRKLKKVPLEEPQCNVAIIGSLV